MNVSRNHITTSAAGRTPRGWRSRASRIGGGLPIRVAPGVVVSCCAALLLAICAPRPFIAVAGGQSVWELTPYRIHALVTVAPGPELTARLRADLPAMAVGRVESLVGAPWDISLVEVPPELQRVMAAGIEEVTLDLLPKDSLEVDKVMLLAIVPTAGKGLPTTESYRVAAREFDVRTQQWGSTVSRQVFQRGKLRDVSAAALFTAFAPLARIEDVSTAERHVVLRLKAGSLPMRDGQTLVSPGDLFRGVVRYNDREGKPRRIATIPWTFCQVYEVTSKEVRCQLHTGLRSPLSSRRRGRVEQFALGVIPPGRPSVLTLQSRSDPQRALAGYDVYARPPEKRDPDAKDSDAKNPGAKKAVLLGRTDRQGRMTIEPADDPLRILVVRNGNEPLARLPIVPGLEPELTALVPDDDFRLEAEGVITGLQEEMVDLVTQRTVLITRTRARIRAGKFDEAVKLIELLRSLPDGPQFARTLAAQKKNLRSSDRSVQTKIDALFADTQELVQKYLAPEAIEEVWQELREAKEQGPMTNDQ